MKGNVIHVGRSRLCLSFAPRGFLLPACLFLCCVFWDSPCDPMADRQKIRFLERGCSKMVIGRAPRPRDGTRTSLWFPRLSMETLD